MMLPPARTLTQRKRDTLRRLERDTDAWVATATPDGSPYLVVLCFHWDGASLLVATSTANVTARNLLARRRARVAIGETRDVVMIDAVVEQSVPAAELPASVGDAYAAKTGWDPRSLTAPHTYFRLVPVRVQAWREINEVRGRTLMRHGRWIGDESPG
jgi:hypothetical protein